MHTIAHHMRDALAMSPEMAEPLGTPDAVRLARQAIRANADGCRPCFAAGVAALARSAPAMLALRRYMCALMGMPPEPPRGSASEADELATIATVPTHVRRDTIATLIQAAADVTNSSCGDPACGCDDQGP